MVSTAYAAHGVRAHEAVRHQSLAMGGRATRCRPATFPAPRRGPAALPARTRIPARAVAPHRACLQPLPRIVTVAARRPAVRSPESAAINSFCPLPDTPAMPTISPARTSRLMAESAVPNGSSAGSVRSDTTSAASPACASRCRGMRQVGADHHARERRRRFVARIALAGDLSRAQHGRLVAQRADFVELVADVENAAAFGGQASQRLEQLSRPPAASAPTSARP